jgi:DNA-binding response OmpR family regulator
MECESILLADDEKTLTNYLAAILEHAGFRTLVAHDGETALRLTLEKRPDIVILDVMMPGLNGREVCRRLRAAGNWTPVIMLTQVSDSLEKAFSLEEGADDYLAKPFDTYELVARIRALLRRARLAPGQKPLAQASALRSGRLILDRRARRLQLGQQAIDLTPKALALLEYMMLHPDELLTRERLLDAVWGWDFPAATRAVDMRVTELRRALEDDPDHPRFIETVVGVGYRFIAPVEPAGNNVPR